MAAIAVIAVAAAAGGDDGESSPAIVGALAEAGFEAGGFAPLSTDDLGDECSAGAIAGIPAILCSYEDAEAAASARDSAGVRGRAFAAGRHLLWLRPAPRVDPDGSVADEIVAAFESAAGATTTETPRPSDGEPRGGTGVLGLE